ncbi:MAG: hypothetical protein ABI634_06245 [Acidobacteriota bacterium]
MSKNGLRLFYLFTGACACIIAALMTAAVQWGHASLRHALIVGAMLWMSVVGGVGGLCRIIDQFKHPTDEDD